MAISQCMCGYILNYSGIIGLIKIDKGDTMTIEEVSIAESNISESEGRNLINGRFLPGNRHGKGRIKGSRNKMTQKFLDRVASRTEDGLSMEEILMDIAQDPQSPLELRYKASSKILDLTLPRAASIEVTMEETKLTKEQIDARLTELLSKGLSLTNQSPASENDPTS